jgi:alpha-beta hydrolase superfamily lysophospholipase
MRTARSSRTGARAVRRRLPLVLAIAAIALVAAIGAVALSAGGDGRPGPFYATPARLARGAHGHLIRAQEIPGFYQGTKAYRVLYQTTGPTGGPVVASGIVVVPEGVPPRGGRPVVAFAHAGVGVAEGCAPSLRGVGAARLIEGLGQFVAAGYIVAASDYVGLGTAGPGSYLVGRLEAESVLDSVRAARRLPGAHAGLRYAVWGQSQGGQAALFAGQLAPAYVPELRLAGVAASAPVAELPALVRHELHLAAGGVPVAMALGTWSRLYPDARLARILTPAGSAAVAQIDRYCIEDREVTAASAGPSPLTAAAFTAAPWAVQPWRSILEQNSPGRAPIAVPVLLTQGGADPLVPQTFTARLARRLCGGGEPVELRVYPGVEHAEAGIVASPDVAAWIAARFRAAAPPSTCGR